MFRGFKVGAFNIKFFRLEGDYNVYQCIGVDERFISKNVCKTYSFKASNNYVLSTRTGFIGISDRRLYLRDEEPVIFTASLEKLEYITYKVGVAITELNNELEKDGAFKPDTFEGNRRCTQF